MQRLEVSGAVRHIHGSLGVKRLRNVVHMFTIMRQMVNPLKPNDLYMSRTAQLTSKRCILYIY